MEDNMKLISDIKRFFAIKKAVNNIKEAAKDNTQLGIDVQKALLNIKADIEVLMGLLPSCVNALGDIKVIIEKAINDIKKGNKKN